MLKKFEINDEVFYVHITIRRTNKNLCLRVKNNQLYVSMPYLVSDGEIKKILTKNFDKIKQKLIPNTQIHYLGRLYDYEVHLANFERVDFLDKIHIYTKVEEQNHINCIIKNAYIDEAQRLIQPYFIDALRDFKDDISKPLSVRYSYLTTAYGKCYPKRGQMTFSGICAKLEPELIRLVVYHEFCHLRFLAHNEKFYAYLESKMPDALVLSKILRGLRVSDFFD